MFCNHSSCVVFWAARWPWWPSGGLLAAFPSIPLSSHISWRTTEPGRLGSLRWPWRATTCLLLSFLPPSLFPSLSLHFRRCSKLDSRIVLVSRWYSKPLVWFGTPRTIRFGEPCFVYAFPCPGLCSLLTTIGLVVPQCVT